MNIFYLNKNPKQCAIDHANAHVIKMVLEYSQLMSTAHRVLDGQEVASKSKTGRNVKRWTLNDERDSILYTATHLNHPSAVWCRQSDSNYRYLHDLLVELCKEYSHRYGRIHKCESSGLVIALSKLPINIPVGNFTEPTPAMDKSYIINNDSIASYRNYYINAKTHLANWNGKVNSRSIPEWYSKGLIYA